MARDCIFCRIASHDLAADVVFEDDDLIVFRDLRPKYRVHLLLVPKTHVASVAELNPAHDAMIGKLLRIGADIAWKEGIAQSGFRLLTNVGSDAGQIVPHLHIHLLGGEPLHPL